MLSHSSEDEIGRFLTPRLKPADPRRAARLRQEARRQAEEKKLAQSLELLRTSPQGYDGLTLRQVQSLRGETLVKALLQRGFELRYADRRAMRWLIYNALQAAEGLRPGASSSAALLDLRALAWAELANAYRVNEEYSEAEAAFARARGLLRQGSGDLGCLARIGQLEASLRASQRRLAEARKLLDAVHRLYLKLGDRHLAGQALLTQGMLTEYDGTARWGVPLFQQGLALIDPDRDPQLIPAGEQGLMTALVGSGEYQKAGRLLLRSGLRQRFADPVRVRWLEGRLLIGLGQLAKGEGALKGVREELLERGQHNDAALVGLDLLPVLQWQGRHGEVRRTARASYDTLRYLGIHHDAAKVLPYLR